MCWKIRRKLKIMMRLQNEMWNKQEYQIGLQKQHTRTIDRIPQAKFELDERRGDKTASNNLITSMNAINGERMFGY